jgi:predicted O-methyltransferase YrrM
LLLEWSEKPPVPAKPDITSWTSITAKEAAELRKLARNREVLEIGSGFGFSTAVLASVANHVLSVDPHQVPPGYGNFFDGPPSPKYQSTYPAVKELLSELGLTDKVDTVFEPSQVLLAEGHVLAEGLGGKLTMAFIDGDHSYDAALADLTNCARILGPGGIIACHDYGEESGAATVDVPRAVDEWRQGRAFRLVDTLAVLAVE